MNYLKSLLSIGLLFAIILALSACSSLVQLPIQPGLESETPNLSQDNFSSFSEMPDVNINPNDSNRSLIGMYTVEFDPETMAANVQPNRESMAHFNVTSYLTPQITIISMNPLTNIWTVKVTLKNTFPVNGYDLRLIVYTDNTSLKLQNPDNWTAIWDIAGGMQINPFIAFNKLDSERKFKSGVSYSETVQVYLPVLAPVKLAIDVSYPGNCLEPYEIAHTIKGILYDKGDKGVTLQARVNDHQNDTNLAVLYCPSISGVTYAPLTKISPFLWELNLKNNKNAAKGNYSAVIIASSTGSGSIPLYDVFTLSVEHSGFPTDFGSVKTWGTDVTGGNGGCYAVGFDSSKNIYAAGSFKYTVDFGDGNPKTSLNYGADACLVKYNADSTFGWVKTWGSAGYYNESVDQCSALAIDGFENAVAVGTFQSTIDFGDGPRYTNGGNDCFVVKSSPDGDLLWAKNWGGEGYDYCESVAADSAGNVYVLGNFFGTVDFGDGNPVTANGYNDIYLIKLDNDGLFCWLKILSGGDSDRGADIVVKGDKIYICGSFSGSMDFGDGTPISANGGNDTFLLVLDTDKNFVHVETWGSMDWDYAESLALNSTGDIYITGYFEYETDFGTGSISPIGGEDCYLLRFDSGYNFTGVKTWGGESYEEPYDMKIGKGDNVYVVGYFEGALDFGDGVEITPLGGADSFICKFGPGGAFKGVKTFGGSGGWTYINSIDTTSDGDLCYGGTFDSLVDFGNGNPIQGGASAFAVTITDIE